MWSARVLGASMALLATAAVAAPGDALVVTGDVVNVRAGPGTDNPVLFHATRDQRVVELTRTGDWVQVQVPDEAADGWIHQSLLAVTEPAPPAPAEAPGSAGAGSVPSGTDALALFRSNVTELNARAVAVAGVELFTGAEPADGGTVRVMVTDAWDLMPEAGQQSYTNALFHRWRAVAGGAEPLRVQVVDPSGTIVSERSGPKTP
ncbi:MAG: SH3 domain-containing protein [Geminicoccaceae bacterium]